jgi:hypothetical protein
MVRDVVTIFGVIAGFSYYVLTVRNARKNQQQQLETRQAQLFQSIYNRYQDQEYVKLEQEIYSYDFTDFTDFNEKYGPEAWTKLVTVGRYFEGLGVHVSRGLIDATMVDDLMSETVIVIWEKAESLVYEYRERMNQPAFAEYFEYLYKQVKTIFEKQHPELAT